LKSLITSVAAFVLCGLAIPISSATAQTAQKIRIGYPSISSRQAQLWIAKDEGIFRKHGLDVELIFLRGGQVAIQALTGGDPPLVTIGNVIIANLQGHDIVLVGSVEDSYDQSVFVRSGIATRMEQLKGKRFGISGFGSATHNAALILFKKFNLEPNKDVAFVPTGTGPERLAAMGAGRIDATFFNPSEVPQALKAGFVEIIQMADIGFEVQGSGLATSRSYIKARRDIVKSALKAYVEGIYYVFANKQATIRRSGALHAHQRSRGSRLFLPALSEAHPEKALSDYERHPESHRHVGAAVAAGEERQARTVRRSELVAGAGDRKVLRRDGAPL
jgi:NitT/TauT family transport system substrate-binding protein